MLGACLMTLAVTLTAVMIGAAIGTSMAAARLSGSRVLRMISGTYNAVLRGVPDLLVIYLVYFGGSTLITYAANALGMSGFAGMPSFLAGALAVGLISGAYQAEVYRAAYLAVPRGQVEAAKAVGMSGSLRLQRIIVPLTLRHALPGLGNVWQIALKESALVSVTGLIELLRIAQIGAGSTHEPFLFYMSAGALYLVLTTLSTMVFRRLETRADLSVRRA